MNRDRCDSHDECLMPSKREVVEPVRNELQESVQSEKFDKPTKLEMNFTLDPLEEEKKESSQDYSVNSFNDSDLEEGPVNSAVLYAFEETKEHGATR